VLRTGRKDLALLTVLGDGGKGAVAVALAWWLLRDGDAAERSRLIAVAAGAAFFGTSTPSG
jgi:glycerol-3-phosphate acyltransferase PlsY